MKISIIIPTINEEKNILRLADILKGVNNIEVIIADGGSHDHTAAIAKKYFRVVETGRGRAKQMNAGAGIASGDVFWFVHADSGISHTMLDSIRKALEDESVIGGGFSIRFAHNSLLLKLIAAGSNRRAKRLKIFFGDQGIFIRRTVFEQVGGFPSIALMEEWMLSKKVRKLGRLVLLNETIAASARRFLKYGILRTFLFMQWLKLLFILGVSAEKLERMYRHG